MVVVLLITHTQLVTLVCVTQATPGPCNCRIHCSCSVPRVSRVPVDTFHSAILFIAPWSCRLVRAWVAVASLSTHWGVGRPPLTDTIGATCTGFVRIRRSDYITP